MMRSISIKYQWDASWVDEAYDAKFTPPKVWTLDSVLSQSKCTMYKHKQLDLEPTGH